MTGIIPLMVANLAATMRRFGAVLPDGGACEQDGLLLVDAGRTVPMFNAAVQISPAETDESFRKQVAAATAFYAQRSSPWCFWVCDGLLSSSVRRSAKRILTEAGLVSAATNPGLATVELSPLSRVLPDLEVRRVLSDMDRQSFCHIMTIAFDSPPHQISTVYGSPALWRDGFQGYLGSVQGQDVSAGAIVADGSSIGIYAVATLPGSMRRGYGEALMRRAVSLVTTGSSAVPLVLQSTPEALRLYRRLGFQRVTSFTVYAHD